jgi:hypothetical protein
MKNKIFMMIMAVMAILLFACNSEKSKQYESLLRFIKSAHIDSCQYGFNTNIHYYSGDTVIEVKNISLLTLIVTTSGGDTIRSFDAFDDRRAIKKMSEILATRWPKPESYSSVCLRKIKNIIANEALDSSSLRKNEKGTRYIFYLQKHKITIYEDDVIPFEQVKAITIHIMDINGEVMYQLSTPGAGSSLQENQDILDLLLLKKQSLKKIANSRTDKIYYGDQWEKEKEEISKQVMEKFNN